MTTPLPIVDRTHEELVDALEPPTFEPTGLQMTAAEAISRGYWLGALNVWLYTLKPLPSIIYQLRPPNVLWEPNKLDVAVGGYYAAGERDLDGLREVKEELGIDLDPAKVELFNRRLAISRDSKNQERKAAINVYIAEYDGELSDMKLQAEEVAGVVSAPVSDVIRILKSNQGSIMAHGLSGDGQPLEYQITPDVFPDNYDGYQHYMAEVMALKLGIKA